MRTRLALIISVLVVLGACSQSAPREAPSRTPTATAGGQPTRASTTPYASYVALGDSYSAGPLIAPSVPAAPAFCARSQANYPGFLASYLAVKTFTDVTCAGATTEDLFASQEARAGESSEDTAGVPPQFDALSADTDLVTIGIGGNDFSLFAKLLNALYTGTDPSGLLTTARSIEPQVAKALAGIAERAPSARIVVIGYLRLAPSAGTCAALPLSPAKVAVADRIERAMNAAVGAAARSAGATFIDSYRLSRGHDACAGTAAWVNGASPNLLAAAPFHPFRAGMDAVAREIYRTLTSKTPAASPNDKALAAVPRG